MEFLEPFHIPAGQAVKIKPQSDCRGTLELQAIVGGPVFLWRGEKTTAQAVLAATDPNHLDFDLAAAVGGMNEIKLESSVGLVSLFSQVESVGYLRFKEVSLRKGA